MAKKNNLFKKISLSFLKFIEKYFMPALTKIGDNRYMLTIRNGVVAAIPMILIGSIFVCIYFFPIGDHTSIVNGTKIEYSTLGSYILMISGHPEWASFIMLPYRLTFAMMGFFVVLAMAKNLAEYYKLDSQQASFIAIIAYFLSLVGPTYTGVDNVEFLSGSMGSSSIFGGGILAILSVEVFRLCVKYNISIKLPKQVPAVVAKPFSALIPMFFVIVPLTLLFLILKFDIHNFILFLFSPLQDFFAGNNIGGMIVLILLITLLWVAGIHGVSIIGSLARPFWITAAEGNIDIIQNNGLENLYYPGIDGASILTEPFYQWFVWIGGAGATIGLIISMLIVAKSKYGKTMTSASAIPVIFNINEPVMFGFPIVMNPTLLIPFILAPIVMGILSYCAMFFGFVALPSLTPAWTLPAPIGAFFSTLDWKSIILCILMIVVSTIIWFPFARAYDKQVLNQERENELLDRINELKQKGETNIDNQTIMNQIIEEEKNNSKRFFWFKKKESAK